MNEFHEEGKVIRISATIYVERESQKGIIIGHKGIAIRKVGMEARRDIERFFDKKVFLQTYVKVDSDWRNSDRELKLFGYNPE